MNPWSFTKLQLAEAVAPFDSALAINIENARELAALRPGIKKLLIQEFAVQALADRICPVERTDGSVALLARSEYVSSDQADALIKRLLASGKPLSEPARYTLPAPLLLALTRQGPGNALPAIYNERTPTALAGVFHDLVQWGVRHHASDLHLNVLLDTFESEVRYTVAGQYVAPERFRHLPTDLLMDVIAVAWMDIQGGNGAVFDPLSEQQGRLERQVDGHNYILRWASLAADRGPSVCLRFLCRDAGMLAKNMLELGYSQQQLNCFDRVLLAEGGAIVFAGMVGSGKSTSLASLLARLPEQRKVITLEEPVEYRIERAIQNSIGRDLHESADHLYAAKLRTIKRSAMTDVLLGEIRDKESAKAFMDLSSSGVNVYTTVHASSARAIVQRLASDFIAVPEDFLLTPGVLKLLVYQVLLPKLCEHCCMPLSAQLLGAQGDAPKPLAYWQTWLSWIKDLWQINPAQMRVRNSKGCQQCQRQSLPALYGYAGRTVAAEYIEPGLSDDIHIGNAYIPDSSSSAMAHAMHKVAAGILDARDVESRFMAFETLVLRRVQGLKNPVSKLNDAL